MRRWAVVLALLVGLSACRPVAPVPESSVWFLEVEREGGYWLGPAALSRMGLEPRADSPPAFSLSADGREIPFLPLETPDGWGVLFFAPYQPARHAARTVLRLEKGGEGVRMRCDESGPGSGPATSGPDNSTPQTPASDGRFLIHLEEDHRYLPQARTEIPWLWAPLYAPGTLTWTVGLTDSLPGPISVTLHLWSHTDFPPAPDHHLRLWWDGRPVGEWEWDGTGVQHLSAQWDEESPSEKHRLALEALLPPGAEASLVWVDGLDITYRRTVRPEGRVWEAESTELRIPDAGPETRVLDVTDPFHPRCLLPLQGQVQTAPGHRYWVGSPEAAHSPVNVRPKRNLDVEQLSGVNYLVVAPPEFHEALRPLLEHRQGQGLAVGVVDPQAVYDTFGGGRPDPEAIRRLVGSLPDLRYLLLVGDASSEQGGYEGEVGALRVVTPLTRTAVLGETPADVLLGTNDRGEATVAVGRFPVSSPEEVSTIVQKTLDWERGGEEPVILVVHDDDPEFADAATEAAHLFESSGLTAQLTGTSAPSPDTLKGERAWLNYFGHGSLTRLGDEGILRLQDGREWRKPALVVTWSCLAAYFIHPDQESMAEVWLRSPGGAVAFLGPVGETTLAEQRPFALAFYRSVLDGERLGDAWLAALRAGDSPDVALGYVLLGDPALVVGGRE